MENKQFYIKVNGRKVPVSEEVYRAYVRPVRTEQRSRRRAWRCVIRGEKYGLVRCKGDCANCAYALSGNAPTGNCTSLDALRGMGFDMQSPDDIEETMIDRDEQIEMSAKLHEAIGRLNERQQYIVREIFFNGKTHEEVRRTIGISKSSMSEAYHNILKLLKNFLREN